jgi:exopolyphosphatase/guanosine-5'-triphosphate,3'-diphosphate pyrophosphatase
VLDSSALARAAAMVCDGPADVVARRHGLDTERVRLLPAGILILDAAARRLGCALQVARGGLREGVCLALAGHAAP